MRSEPWSSLACPFPSHATLDGCLGPVREPRTPLNLRPRLAATLFGVSLLASCAAPGERSLTVYGGAYSDNALVEEILPLREIKFEEAYLGVAAYAEPLHRFWGGEAQWEWEVQAGKYWGGQDHWELNALIILRWMHFPWNRHVRTTFAIGDGLSWASEVPKVEQASHTNEGATQVLNYLLLEWTLGLPEQPDWDLSIRVHHRSGIFGLFDGVHGGSNVLAAGLKFTF